MADPTFPVISAPNIGTRITTLDNSLKSEQTNGCVITRKKYSRQLHKFELHWKALSQIYYADLEAFYQSCNAGSASFAWVDDMNVSRTVRFDSPLVAFPVSDSKWDVTAILAEV